MFIVYCSPPIWRLVMNLLLKDVIDLAVKMEHDGAQFYDRLAHLSQNKKAKEILRSFAEDERSHEETFKKIKSSESELIINSILDDDVTTLVNEISQEDILPSISEEDIKTIHPLSAIKIGIKTEKNTLKLYKHILKKLKSEQSKRTVAALIDEEKRHHNELTEMHKNKTFDF